MNLRRTIVVCLLFLLAPSACGADALRVLVVQSDNKPLYHTFAKVLADSLPATVDLSLRVLSEDFDAQRADLVVTVGVAAADWVADRTSRPMIAAMIPADSYAGLLEKRGSAKKTSAIYLDQPWARQVKFVRAALPERRRVGVLYAAETRVSVQALRAEFARSERTLIARPLHDPNSLFADLEEVLAASDVLLAVPDAGVYNGSSIRNILLSSYRRGIPLVGFSQAYVRAGALCAIFSTPEQLAAQTGAAIISFAGSGDLPEARYPALYTIDVNQEVARTLGISVSSANLLRLQVDKPSGNSR